MRRLFLAHAAPGDLVDDVFVFQNKQLSTTSTGKYFIKAFVSDRTSQLNARMWNATQDLFADLPETGFVHIQGRVENYQQNLQLIIDRIDPPEPGTYDVADLLPTTNKDIPAMFDRVKQLLGDITNPDLKAIAQAYLDDERLMADFCRAPAAMSFHHAYIGGLLEHTLNAMEASRLVCTLHPLLNHELVLLGVFVHDLAKTWELSYESAFDYTDGGRLVGHIVKGSLWLEDKARAAARKQNKPLPRPLVEVLHHIILSHHGLPEYGAAREPATPEALAVHLIENMDAKLTMALHATRGEAAQQVPGDWTDFNKALNSRLYRPDVAPAFRKTPSADAEGQRPPHAPADAQPLPSATPAAPAADKNPADENPAGGKLGIVNPLFGELSNKRK